MARNKILTIIGQSSPKRKFPELTAQQREKFKNTSDIILAILAVAGSLTLSLLAPNAFKILGGSQFKSKNTGARISSKQKKKKLAQAFYYLKKSGKIKIKPTLSDITVSITNLGQKSIDKLSLKALHVRQKALWDRKWWLVAADIPTKHYRQGADLLRKKLKELGFFPFQRSLWIYPFDPRKEIEFINREYGIENFVTVMEINRIDKEDERVLKEHFRKINVFV